jgi:hypothetical protein
MNTRRWILHKTRVTATLLYYVCEKKNCKMLVGTHNGFIICAYIRVYHDNDTGQPKRSRGSSQVNIHDWTAA